MVRGSEIGGRQAPCEAYYVGEEHRDALVRLRHHRLAVLEPLRNVLREDLERVRGMGETMAWGCGHSPHIKREGGRDIKREGGRDAGSVSLGVNLRRRTRHWQQSTVGNDPASESQCHCPNMARTLSAKPSPDLPGPGHAQTNHKEEIGPEKGGPVDRWHRMAQLWPRGQEFPRGPIFLHSESGADADACKPFLCGPPRTREASAARGECPRREKTRVRGGALGEGEMRGWEDVESHCAFIGYFLIRARAWSSSSLERTASISAIQPSRSRSCVSMRATSCASARGAFVWSSDAPLFLDRRLIKNSSPPRGDFLANYFLLPLHG